MNINMLERYAELVVKMGLNIQENQILVIHSPLESREFAKLITEKAYNEGAREVIVKWADEEFTKMKYMMANDEVFDEFPSYEKEFYLSLVRKDAAFLRISASDPDMMKDVDPSKMVRFQKAAEPEIKEYRDRMMSSKNVWSVVSVPTKGWAKKVFPNVTVDEATEKLWDAIFKAVRADKEDTIAAWETHNTNLKNYKEKLNEYNFRTLIVKNEIGTDLEINLPKGHIWDGGSEHCEKGTRFFPNMPTEEVFSMPERNGVNGVVVSSKPLNYNGSLIEDFSLTFKEGRIVDFTAKKGYEQLKSLVETDEGSHYLGEVALVAYDSPISNMNIMFYNTLFDENASCHLAIGKAYPTCIENGENMTKEEMLKNGVNDSLVHVDFMYGTKDLSVVGIKENGEQIVVMENGDIVI
ncbi:aminopeptidase [Helicovermis profundi]|uniref:Aminopeptidase n=1 Tax=Helicovermis profundi TaxID=3065157 RepID=A0AAU9EG90_9FIRM|nr:aminopeptidase [Clostridia bacterium S502]